MSEMAEPDLDCYACYRAAGAGGEGCGAGRMVRGPSGDRARLVRYRYGRSRRLIPKRTDAAADACARTEPMKGALTLSDLRVDKIAIRCECGLERRYDRLKLMEKVGDYDLPSLLRKLADAEGCKRAYTVDIHNICQMAYGPGVIPAP